MIRTCSFELAIYNEVLSNCDDFRYWISGIFITDFRRCIQSRYFELLWLVALKWQFISKLYPAVMTDFGFTLDTEFRGILLPIFGVSFKGQFSEASSRRFQVSTRIENCQLCIFQKKISERFQGIFNTEFRDFCKKNLIKATWAPSVEDFQSEPHFQHCKETT